MASGGGSVGDEGAYDAKSALGRRFIRGSEVGEGVLCDCNGVLWSKEGRGMELKWLGASVGVCGCACFGRMGI